MFELKSFITSVIAFIKALELFSEISLAKLSKDSFNILF